MRLLFLLLLLVNVAFYAYAFVLREQGSAGQQLAQLQIAAERIRIVSGPEAVSVRQAPQAPAAPPVTGAPAACVEWGLFAGAEVARAEAAIAALGLPAAQLARSVVDAGGYWVYIPPAKSKAEVERRLGELKALGIADFFVVQDAGPWRNAISLGIFKTDEAAKNRLAELQSKGVRSAVSSRRENLLRQFAYYIREPGPDAVARLAELQREFPGTQVRAVACPAGESG
jgi:hypothetical protein